MPFALLVCGKCIEALVPFVFAQIPNKSYVIQLLYSVRTELTHPPKVACVPYPMAKRESFFDVTAWD